MMRGTLILVVLLGVAFLALLTPAILSPALYTPASGSPTAYHANPAALGERSQERSGELSALMQDLLDSHQPVALNIRIRDFEEAERALQEYSLQSQRFDRLVVTLDLSDSAVGDFRKETQKNRAALERILNESVRFAEIDQLAIRYRDEQNPALLYTVTFEGEAVQNAIDHTTTELVNRSPDLIAISGGLGLDTSRFAGTVDLLNDIVLENRAIQDDRQAARPELHPSTLTLSVIPESGRYGDELRITGTRTSLPDSPVTLVLDSREWQTVEPDEAGIFRTTLPLGRIRSGEHLLYAAVGRMYSGIVSFTVQGSDTSLILDLSPGTRWDIVTCTGTLTTRGMPVAGAPVSIVSDGSLAGTATTGTDGIFTTTVTLPAGEHTLQAVFENDDFPLNPSRSSGSIVHLSSPPGLPTLLILGAVIITVAAAGAAWFLRWFREVEPVLSATLDHSWSPDPGSATPALSIADISSRYRDLVAAGDPGSGARLLFHALIDRLSAPRKTQNPYSLTPRELAARDAGEPYEAPLRSFARGYELIRYQGLSGGACDHLFAAWSEVLTLEGGDSP